MFFFVAFDGIRGSFAVCCVLHLCYKKYEELKALPLPAFSCSLLPSLCFR